MGQLRRNGQTAEDLFRVIKALSNRGFTDPAVAKASTTTLFKTTNTFQYCVGGVVTSKAATDNIANTNLTSTAAGQSYYARLEIDVDGTFSWSKGKTITGTAGISDVPPRSAGKVTVAYVKIPASFTVGTTDTDAAGVVVVDGDPDLIENQNDYGVEA